MPVLACSLFGQTYQTRKPSQGPLSLSRDFFNFPDAPIKLLFIESTEAAAYAHGAGVRGDRGYCSFRQIRQKPAVPAASTPSRRSDS